MIDRREIMKFGAVCIVIGIVLGLISPGAIQSLTVGIGGCAIVLGSYIFLEDE